MIKSSYARTAIIILCILIPTVGIYLWLGYNHQNHLDPNPGTNPSAAPTGFTNSTTNTNLPSPQIHLSQVAASPTITPFSVPSPQPTSTPVSNAKQVIGYSVENRPLEVYQFGHGDRHLMIVAGIHGGYEWNTVSLADQLIKTLKDKPELMPDDRTLYILRVVNPDGYAKAKDPDGRMNAHDVDLNRNWDANWQPNWSGAHCWNTRFMTAGSAPMSEPETKALAKFITDNHIEALISYHSAALGIFSGGWPKDQSSIKLANALARVSPYSFPPVATDCVYTGQLIDWASAQGVAAVDIELTNHIDTDINTNLRILKAFLAWSA